MTKGNYRGYLDALGMRESSNNYLAENQFGYLGRYQMGELALDDAGYYNSNDGTASNDWIGTWTGKDGINSKDDFLNSPSGQDAPIEAYHARVWSYIENIDLAKYDGQILNDVEITASGMISGAHLVGIGNLKT